MRICRRRGDMKRGTILVLVIMGLYLTAPASADVRPVTVGGNFTMGFPVEEFKDNVDEIGIGGHGYIAMTLPGTPLQLGGSFGYMSQGSARIKTEVLIPGGAILPVDVVTRNNVFMGHLLLRLQPTQTALRPYADGLFGFGRFWTTTEVTVFEETEISTNRGLDDWTTSYGIGGGLMVEVWRTTMPAEDEDDIEVDATVCVDLGVRYLVGGKADYAKTNTVDQDGNFDTTSSRTDMVTVHIGVAFQFF
jgi:opacity protein-like surface antigen